MKRQWAFIAVGLVAFSAAYIVFHLRHSLVRERQLGIGGRFPTVELQLMGDNSEEMRLPSGKKTLVVFFRHDCPHCTNELSRLDRACQQPLEGTLDCVAVSFSQEVETRAWAATNGLGLKIALVRDPGFTKRYIDWLMAVPLVFLIDEEGIIRYKRA